MSIEAAGGTVHRIDVPGGVRLRAAHFPGGGRGTVLVLNGRTEFIEKYLEPIAALQARGFAAWAFDWRGQGASSRGEPDGAQHVRHFDEYLGDVRTLLDRHVVPGLDRKKLVLFGHSMGGHLGLHLLSRRPELFERAVICAPMLGLLRRGKRPPPFAGALVGLSCLLPGGGAAVQFGDAAAA